MDEIETGNLKYPTDAAQVRDLIADMVRSQVDHGSSMDTGGGFGSADLWISFGGVEYFVSVKSPPVSGSSDLVRQQGGVQ